MDLWQTLFVKNDINGKSLKDNLIEDGVIIARTTKTGKTTYKFDPTRISDDIKSGSVMKISESGNDIDCIFEAKSKRKDFFDTQLEVAMQISKMYPDTTFALYSSYIALDGVRKTGIDEYLTNGQLTDSKGQPVEETIIVPKEYFFRDDSAPDSVGIVLYKQNGNNVTSLISRKDVELEDNGWVRICKRPGDKSMDYVIKHCKERLETDRMKAVDSMYEVEAKGGYGDHDVEYIDDDTISL